MVAVDATVDAGRVAVAVTVAVGVGSERQEHAVDRALEAHGERALGMVRDVELDLAAGVEVVDAALVMVGVADVALVVVGVVGVASVVVGVVVEVKWTVLEVFAAGAVRPLFSTTGAPPRVVALVTQVVTSVSVLVTVAVEVQGALA